MLAEGRHIFRRRPKPRAAKRVAINTWQKLETALEKSLAPRVIGVQALREGNQREIDFGSSQSARLELARVRVIGSQQLYL